MQLESITLYIRPDDGPIMPIELLMLDIELVAMQSTSVRNRDQARVEAIINLIKANFPRVQPEGSREQLRQLISRLVHIAIYDGIVLRLPGTIDGPPPPASYDLAQVQEIEEKAQELESQLLSEREGYAQQSKKDQGEIAALSSENTILRRQDLVWQTEKQQLIDERKVAEDQAYKSEQDAKKKQDRILVLEEEKAELQTQLDKERQESKRAADLQRKVAALQNQISDAKEEERRLQKRLREEEQENKELRERVERLSNDPTLPASIPAKNTAAKDPFLD